MPCCERCWSMARGQADEYHRQLAANQCSPEQQAGPEATDCPKCQRKTVHQYAKVCTACGWTPAPPSGAGKEK